MATNNVKSVPEGYGTLTPYLCVADGQGELEFLIKAFGAQELFASRDPEGRIMHAELKIGTSMLMLGQAGGPWKPLPAAIYMYVDDVDAVYARALAAGAKSTMEVKDQFYGDRSGGVEDPNGISWWIATHVEDVAPDELERRAKAAQGGGGS